MRILRSGAKPALFFLLLVVLAACEPSGTPVTTAPAAGDSAVSSSNESSNPDREKPAGGWGQFVSEYIEAFFVAHPAFAVVQGRHEFDGQLPDWSAEGLSREIARLHRAREDALDFSDEDLGEEGQYQREYLLAAIDQVLFWLEKAEWPFVNPAYYFDWLSDSLDPSTYITLNYAPLEVRIKSYTRYAQNIPGAVDQIRANLRMPMARTRLEYGIDSFGGFADYFSNDVPAGICRCRG